MISSKSFREHIWKATHRFHDAFTQDIRSKCFFYIRSLVCCCGTHTGEHTSLTLLIFCPLATEICCKSARNSNSWFFALPSTWMVAISFHLIKILKPSAIQTLFGPTTTVVSLNVWVPSVCVGMSTRHSADHLKGFLCRCCCGRFEWEDIWHQTMYMYRQYFHDF